MTSDPQYRCHLNRVGDKEDLDALFKDAKPIGDGSGWACPAFFESDEEPAEFVSWYRGQRQGRLPEP